MKSLILTATALATLAITGGLANAAQFTRPTPITLTNHPIVLTATLACKVAGPPVEFPNSLYITNTARLGTAAKGTVVHWSVPSYGHSGLFVLTADIAPGNGMWLSDVNPGGVEAGTKCQASF